MFSLSKHRVLFFFLIMAIVLSGTFLAIKFASGYKIDFATRKFKPTGILIANSNPAGGRVFVNGKFVAATNGPVSLEPGAYAVEIKKEGFATWKKNLYIEKELVTLADTFLFPDIPDLIPLTFNEVSNPVLAPDKTKIVYSIPLPNPDAGLWIIDLTDSLFNFSRGPKQIAKSRLGNDLSKAIYSWSPDSRQIILEFSSLKNKYLLDPNQFNELSATNEVSLSLLKIKAGWQKEEELKKKSKERKLPLKMLEILASNSAELTFSPDGTKIVYLATASAEIPEKLIPPVLAASTQKESRRIEKDKLYVYDIKEDRNFFIPFDAPKPTPKPAKTRLKPTPTTQLLTFNFELSTPQWFPTSRHLVWINEDKIVTIEYDGTNLTTIYSGPFVKPFVFLTPGTNKLAILTKIDAEKEAKPNLYFVSLR